MSKRRLEPPLSSNEELVRRVVKRTLIRSEYREPQPEEINWRYQAKTGEPCLCGFASTYKRLGQTHCKNCGGVIE